MSASTGPPSAFYGGGRPQATRRNLSESTRRERPVTAIYLGQDADDVARGLARASSSSGLPSPPATEGSGGSGSMRQAPRFDPDEAAEPNPSSFSSSSRRPSMDGRRTSSDLVSELLGSVSSSSGSSTTGSTGQRIHRVKIDTLSSTHPASSRFSASPSPQRANFYTPPGSSTASFKSALTSSPPPTQRLSRASSTSSAGSSTRPGSSEHSRKRSSIGSVTSNSNNPTAAHNDYPLPSSLSSQHRRNSSLPHDAATSPTTSTRSSNKSFKDEIRGHLQTNSLNLSSAPQDRGSLRSTVLNRSRTAAPSTSSTAPSTSPTAFSSPQTRSSSSSSGLPSSRSGILSSGSSRMQPTAQRRRLEPPARGTGSDLSSPFSSPEKNGNEAPQSPRAQNQAQTHSRTDSLSRRVRNPLPAGFRLEPSASSSNVSESITSESPSVHRRRTLPAQPSATVSYRREYSDHQPRGVHGTGRLNSDPTSPTDRDPGAGGGDGEINSRSVLARIERENEESARKRQALMDNQAMRRAESSMSVAADALARPESSLSRAAEFDRRFPPRTPVARVTPRSMRQQAPSSVSTHRPSTAMSYLADDHPPRSAPPAQFQSRRDLSARDSPSPKPRPAFGQGLRGSPDPQTRSPQQGRRPATSAGGAFHATPRSSPSIIFPSSSSTSISKLTASNSDHLRNLANALAVVESHFAQGGPAAESILLSAEMLLDATENTNSRLSDALLRARHVSARASVDDLPREHLEGLAFIVDQIKSAKRTSDEEIRALTTLLLALPKHVREARSDVPGADGGMGRRRQLSHDERTRPRHRTNSDQSQDAHDSDHTARHYQRPPTAESYAHISSPNPRPRLPSIPSGRHLPFDDVEDDIPRQRDPPASSSSSHQAATTSSPSRTRRRSGLANVFDRFASPRGTGSTGHSDDPSGEYRSKTSASSLNTVRGAGGGGSLFGLSGGTATTAISTISAIPLTPSSPTKTLSQLPPSRAGSPEHRGGLLSRARTFSARPSPSSRGSHEENGGGGGGGGSPKSVLRRLGM